MKTYIQKLISLLSIFTLLIGCATTPMNPTLAKNVPKERVYFDNLPDSPSLSKIVIVRDKTTIGWGSIGYHQIFINGKLAASIASTEKLELNLEPDDYEIGVINSLSVDTKEPLLTGWSNYTIDQNLKPGKTYYYRVLIDSDSSSRVQRYTPTN